MNRINVDQRVLEFIAEVYVEVSINNYSLQLILYQDLFSFSRKSTQQIIL